MAASMDMERWLEQQRKNGNVHMHSTHHWQVRHTLALRHFYLVEEAGLVLAMWPETTTPWFAMLPWNKLLVKKGLRAATGSSKFRLAIDGPKTFIFDIEADGVITEMLADVYDEISIGVCEPKEQRRGVVIEHRSEPFPIVNI